MSKEHLHMRIDPKLKTVLKQLGGVRGISWIVFEAIIAYLKTPDIIAKINYEDQQYMKEVEEDNIRKEEDLKIKKEKFQMYTCKNYKKAVMDFACNQLHEVSKINMKVVEHLGKLYEGKLNKCKPHIREMLESDFKTLRGRLEDYETLYKMAKRYLEVIASDRRRKYLEKKNR